MPFDETRIRIHQLAMLIADDAARTDVEIQCPSFTGDGREPVTAEEIRSAWYDISLVDAEMATIIRTAVSYLALRGQVIHHPSNQNWIRVQHGKTTMQEP